MTRLNVNPTRMQLKTLKQRLKIAVRGHKLLKDKSDEMIRRFSSLIKSNYVLRRETEKEVKEVLKDFCLAKGFMPNSKVLSIFAFPVKTYTVQFLEKNIMNFATPDIKIFENEDDDLPYSYIDVSGEMDILVKKLKNIVPKMVNLASLEKTCQILSSEIEKTKRRVNALEFVMIPSLQETIKYITMKIEENDRASRIRLIKVKSIMEKRDS